MNENVYFECRKRAAIHNERLNSRAGAAEILGISESTLAHYELGITKNIPVLHQRRMYLVMKFLLKITHKQLPQRNRRKHSRQNIPAQS